MLLNFENIELMDLITIVAIVVGPITAVQVQKRIEAFRSRQDSQLHIFRTLMATRATRLNPEHVMALNLIDLNFSEKRKREKPVVRSWRVLLDQFGKYPRIENYQNRLDEYKIALNSADTKSQELLIDLLSKMSDALGYDFETIHISNGCYAPTGHAEIENDQTLIRKGVIAMLGGQIPVNMNVLSLPEQAPHDSVAELFQNLAANQAETLQILKNITSGEANLSVSMSNKNNEDSASVRSIGDGTPTR